MRISYTCPHAQEAPIPDFGKYSYHTPLFTFVRQQLNTY